MTKHYVSLNFKNLKCVRNMSRGPVFSALIHYWLYIHTFWSCLFNVSNSPHDSKAQNKGSFFFFLQNTEEYHCRIKLLSLSDLQPLGFSHIVSAPILILTVLAYTTSLLFWLSQSSSTGNYLNQSFPVQTYENRKMYSPIHQ